MGWDSHVDLTLKGNEEYAQNFEGIDTLEYKLLVDKYGTKCELNYDEAVKYKI
jgi:hypothetical protein